MGGDLCSSLSQTAGMGKKQYAEYVDFVPTSFAIDVMRNRSWNQDDG